MKRTTPQQQREFAVDVVRRLRDAGYEAYWAGGCVRDHLIGREPQDYDVATSARPDQIRKLFTRRRTLPIGAAFGVITVLGPRGAGQIDVATFREDLAYRDGRHPDGICFSTAQQDAERRDFTINGLFYDPQNDEVIDFVGGQADLQAKMIRAIGAPQHRFKEDKLRMLRAVRFAATFGFEIEEETFHALRTMAPDIVVVSAERIGEEMKRMLLDPGRQRALRLLRDSGLLHILLPELERLFDDECPRWEETLNVLNALVSPTPALALAALLHKLDNPADVTTVGQRWRWPNKVIGRARWIVAHHRRIEDARRRDWAEIQRLLVHRGADELLALREAIASPDDPDVRYCRERQSLPGDQLDPEPLISGDDLVARGLRPGKIFSTILKRVRDAQLRGKIATRQQALHLADRIAAEDRHERPKE